MKEFPIPIRATGLGSQLVDDELQYLAMPREMNTFRKPNVPQSAEALPLAEARAALALLLQEMGRWDPVAAAHGPRLDLAGMSPAALAITNQMLGEGEVSIRVDGEPTFRIQESVFTGLWRVCAYDGDGALGGDWIEAATIPRIVGEIAKQAAAPRIADVVIPPGAMNSPALLAEITAQVRVRRPNRAAHLINLTLFPMTPDDHRVLEGALPVGPVAIMSRGFGNCRITSTGTRDVWRVQYFNSMSTLILNTIEIVDVPEVALAAAEDLEDSRVRLSDLIDWMSESCAP